MLTGITQSEAFTKEPYASDWYTRNYNSYSVDTTQNLKSDSIEIDVFFGSWCGDCHKHLPAFIKIAEHYKLNYRLIGLNTKKVSHTGLEDSQNIKRAPTFIVKKQGSEIGRIIEYPVESLEKDLGKIFNAEPYTPNYAD